MNKMLFSLAALFFIFSQNAHAHEVPSPDEHAPIGVMGDHAHGEGEWMASYRYSRMEMSGAIDGTDDLTPAQVRAQGFMAAPLSMTTEMHMFGLMYGFSNDVTFMAMLPYIRKEMTAENMTTRFTTQSEGLGDIKVGALWPLQKSMTGAGSDRSGQSLILKTMLSLPTGSIDERDNTPMGANRKLAYPMQLGSGTFDPNISLTYASYLGDWSYGVQARTTVRFGKNDEGYRLGHEGGLTTWGAYRVNDWWSISARVDGRTNGDIHGRDSDLMLTMSPGARTDLRSGQRVDGLMGINLIIPEGTLKNNRLAFEIGAPLYTNVDGPQLKGDWRMMLGWQLAF